MVWSPGGPLHALRAIDRELYLVQEINSQGPS